MFSLRIVNVDSYQNAPTKGYDICYSEFRGSEIFKVPIIRIFGITPAGQKGCLHVHGVFPYFSIRCKDVFPNIEAKSLRKYMQELALDIDKALNVASRNSNSHRHHVYKIVVTEHIPFYGFHEKAEEFLKIYFYNPFDVSRTAELMTNGVILNKFIQPYEAHIPYILQFFIDYNLFGMNLINVSKFKFRASEDDLISAVSPLRNQSLSHILDESSTNKIWNMGTFSSSQISSLPRQTVCELEVDCCSSEIMNRLNESFSSGKNPGLLAIWEEERQRRKSENDTSQIVPVPSQERADFIETESENFYKKKLRKILESFDVFKMCQKDKMDHMSRDLEDLSSPNISDLSSTQDEEMLNMMLSLVNSQSAQLDDDSILGLNHQNDMQSESVEDETVEMSQLFTGELEEMWSSQMLNSDSDKNRTNSNTSTNTLIDQPELSNESVMIPQLDGAFDEDFETDNKHSKKKNKENSATAITDELLIKSYNLLQPVVLLSPTVIVKADIESPAESRPESDIISESMDDDSTLSTPKRTSLPVCVPVSKNAHCSLIMNIYENSNDVSIEHTCTSRNSVQYDSLADAEDPSNVVFEIITNLIYKVECLTEGKASCYEHLTEEYYGEKSSDVLLQGLNKEEKNTLQQIKVSPSIFKDKHQIRKENYIDPYLSLPIKKRIFNNSWDRKDFNQCDTCNHSLSIDFSKIGKEIVLVKKLSEADFVNHVKFNSLKVVIPPLPLNVQIENKLTTNLKKDNRNSKPMSLLPKKDSKSMTKKISNLKNNDCDSSGKLPTNKTETVCDYFKPNTTSTDQQKSFTSSSKEKSSTMLPAFDYKKVNDTVSSPSHSMDNESNQSMNFKMINDNIDCRSTISNTDSKFASSCTDFKICTNSPDSKFIPDNADLNIPSDNSDLKSTSDNTDSKVFENNSDSLIIPDSFEPVIVPNNLDFLISPKSLDSLITHDNEDSKIAVDNTDSKISSDCEDSKIAANNTDSKISSDCEDSKITLNDTNSGNIEHDVMHSNTYETENKIATCKRDCEHSDYKVTFDNMNKTATPTNYDCNKPNVTLGGERKYTSMSELRLYRRKKSSVVREHHYPTSSTKMDSNTYDEQSGEVNSNTASIGSRVHERNSSDLKIEYVGTTSKYKTPDSAPKYIPVVQLEPCKELIDKYCKNEIDSDCLILREVSHEQKTPPTVKEKRFFRSRVQHQKYHNLSSNIIINHKLGINSSKYKTNRFLPTKRGRRNSLTNFTVQRTNGPNLRKRCANFDSPDKKKLQPNLDSKYTLFSSEKNSLEQVYDFESHLNADENNLDDKCFSRYSLKNRLNCNTSKKNVSCKLSLKLNRKKINEAQDDYVPEYGISINSESQKIVRPRRTSSVVSYNEDEYQPLEENQILTKTFKKSSYKDFQNLPENENSSPDDMNSVDESDEISDWSIDDIPISHLKPNEGLKCTISKKKNNIYTSHESKKLPIPKFKVRKKKGTSSLNVSIKLKQHPLDLLDNDPNFKEKSYYCVPSKKKKGSKKSKKKSHAFASALDVKHKYRKQKESRNESFKKAILQYCNSMIKNKNSSPSVCIKNNEQDIPFLNKKPDFCQPYVPSLSSYNTNSTPKEENSISNSPFAEDNSDDSKKSKSSLKMKLKLKRITTRSNEERIVVVGKELEGIEVESDENENSEIPTENTGTSELLNNSKIDEKPKTCKKTLGTKGIKNDLTDFKLKKKFKCPLYIDNKKVEKSISNNEKNINKENFKDKIPKFKYKPLLANISRDLYENEYNTIVKPLSTDASPHKILIISPKKKSPLKNAESIKKELAQLNEMSCASVNISNSDNFRVDLKIPSSGILTVDNHIQRKLSTEEINSLLDNDLSSSTLCRLRERKLSSGSKISSRRNSLRCQDFKQYFDSDNEDNVVEPIPQTGKKQENVDCVVSDMHLACKPCTVDLEKLHTVEIEKYVCQPVVNLHKSESIMACEPLVASFPSPVVESKSADSYIDPRKVFENLFTFSSPSHCHSPLNFNTFETSALIIDNDMSCGPFSNESSEHSRKEIMKTNFTAQNPLKPSDVFKSIERDDMGVLWNLAYFSPPQIKALEKAAAAAEPVIEKRTKDSFDQKDNSVFLDDFQNLVRRANEVSSASCNLMEYESENSISVMNEKLTESSYKDNVSNKESKISFENILEKSFSKVLDDLDNIPSFSQTPTEFEVEQIMSNKSETFDAAKETAVMIKEEPKSDPVFEPMESLPNVRILDFQECLVESDSEMNPLLNDSEMDSVMSSADMILSNSGLDTHNYEQCLQTDLTLDDQSLSVENKQKCASEEPKTNGIDDVFIKSSINSSLQKQLDADLTCNNAIITAADTSSLLIPSYKNNTIPVLAINNPCQEATVNFAAFDEQSLNANGQFFPVMLAPVPVAEDPNYLDSSAAVVKENESDPQECVNFLEDNELLQSCSVSSTSDIENKNTQTSNALGIPFNGEEDILSMIVKSCDIGEEFDVNMNAVEETESGSISSAALCNNLVDSNYVMSGPNFIISSQADQNSFQTNSENAVSSSSENNLLQKNPEIVVIKTEPINVPDVEHIVYELQDKSLSLSHTNKNVKSSEELGHDDNVLLDSMIHSFYGDDSLYGLRSSATSDNISLLCPTFQNNSFSQDMEKLAECSTSSFKSSVIKAEDNTVETCSYKSDSYFKNLCIPQNESFQFKTAISTDKVPLSILSNSLFVAHSFPKISSKRFHFTPSCGPPTRDFIENSVIKTEIDEDVKLNAAVEDSLSSASSLSPQTSTNDALTPNVFNKTSLDENEHLGSQNFHILSKSTPHRDGKVSMNSPVMYQDRTISNLSFSHHLASTPSTSNIKKEFTLPDVVVSPINKETGLIADTSKRKRKLLFEDDSDGPIKMFKPGREKMYGLYNKYGRNRSFNKTTDSLGNLSFSQIEGPTLENSRGFKVSSDNFGDAQVRHEVQHLTVMSLEIHVNTRNDLRPNPKFDSVTAIFYCIYNDIGISEEEEIVGMIVVDPGSHHQTSGQNSSETLKNYLLLCPGVKNGFIYCVENEISLFEKLVRVIREWDPDILTGYEIQMSSWGYLVERAEMLNINLRLLLSRLTDKSEAKLIPIDPDPTVTDQTADVSRLNIIGRIVLCVWRLMRKEVTLNVYSFENVYYHVLHKRTPLYAFHDLTNWFLGSQKEKVIRYYVIRVQGNIHLLEKLDTIGRTSELARLFGIQFYEVLSRGTQFRVESMMLRTAAPMSYIPVSPSVRQRSHSRAPECVPLILEPESRFYIDPVVVLDFQSLYPSMIIAYNYCFSTCLGRVEHFGKNVPFEFGCTSLSVPVTLLQKFQNDIHISPTGIAFIKSSVRRGILPSMLEEILNTRIMVKQSMKKFKDNNALKRLLDARQLGLKLIANVTYGYTGAAFSGRMPSVEVADSIVGKGRETLERAIHMIENTSKWRAKVVYGDTDSLFILLPGRTKKQAFEIGQEIADAVTADNPKPVKLKFEKVYLPCVLQTKKRYVGFMYESVDQEDPVFDAKGIETVRRDSCPATGKILEKSLKILFKSYDVSLVKNYVQKQFSKLLSGRASIIDCIFAKEYRGISGYRPGACVPALEIAKKRLAKDPRSEPRVGERVPYVVVCGFPGLPIIQLVREPIELLRDVNLRLNASYYITRVISPPLERVFNLLGADVKSWYTNLAHTFKPTLPMIRSTNQHRGTLSQYFVTLSCPSCEKPTFTTVCDDCREDLQGTTIALNEKIRQWERTVDHLTQICGSCTKSGSSIDLCVSLDCPMLFKLSAAKKDLSQAPYLRKVLAHELF